MVDPVRARFSVGLLTLFALIAGACSSNSTDVNLEGAGTAVAAELPTSDPTEPAQEPASEPTPTQVAVEVVATEPDVESGSIEDRNAELGRGINLGNALEAPNEGDWGVVLEAGYFDTIAEAGFDSVRIPVRWSAHAAESAPYSIDPDFFERVDWALDQAERVGLTAVLNMHHYEELHLDPAAHSERFLALWDQIAARYAQRPQTVYFEPLNEPADEFTDQPDVWNELFAEALALIREQNPERAVIVGPVQWNHPESLDSLLLPPDPNLIVTIHFYEPFEFTHQGATWIDAQLPIGVSWSPDSLGPIEGWHYASWDARGNSEGASIDVTFDEQWGSLGFRTEHPIAARAVAVEALGPATLDILCGIDGSFETVDRINVGAQWGFYSVDLSSCGSATTDIALQNVLVEAGPLAVRSVEVCTANECEQVLGTQADRLSAFFAGAQRWSESNGRPMYVGEFGAYFEADLESRSAWTERVQQSARSAGMSTSYWEFISGYGAYDGDTAQWRRPLLDALFSDL